MGPPADAVDGAVDAEQRGRAGDAAAMEQVADRDKRRSATDLLLTPDVDRQLSGLVQLLRQRNRADLAGEQPGPLERDQAVALDGMTSSSRFSIRARVSTATDTRGRSSDRVSSRSVEAGA